MSVSTLVLWFAASAKVSVACPLLAGWVGLSRAVGPLAALSRRCAVLLMSLSAVVARVIRADLPSG